MNLWKMNGWMVGWMDGWMDGCHFHTILGLTEQTGTQCLPREEFELTANSIGAHIETHGGPILRTLTVNAQDDSHCELCLMPRLTALHSLGRASLC